MRLEDKRRSIKLFYIAVSLTILSFLIIPLGKDKYGTWLNAIGEQAIFSFLLNLLSAVILLFVQSLHGTDHEDQWDKSYALNRSQWKFTFILMRMNTVLFVTFYYCDALIDHY